MSKFRESGETPEQQRRMGEDNVDYVAARLVIPRTVRYTNPTKAPVIQQYLEITDNASDFLIHVVPHSLDQDNPEASIDAATEAMVQADDRGWQSYLLGSVGGYEGDPLWLNQVPENELAALTERTLRSGGMVIELGTKICDDAEDPVWRIRGLDLAVDAALSDAFVPVKTPEIPYGP
jgi:hypothetical protein